MMNNLFPWALGIIAAFGSSNFLFYGIKRKDFMLLSYGIAYFLMGLASIAIALGAFNSTFNQIDRGILFSRFAIYACHMFFYSGLAIMLRDTKPEFARFPIAFVSLPLFLIFLFPLANTTPIILEWVQLIFQAGAVLILSMVVTVLGQHNRIFYRLLWSSLFFTISVLLYYLKSIPELISEMWRWPFLLGVTIFAFYFDRIISNDIVISPDYIPTEN